MDSLTKILPEEIRNDFNGLDKDQLVRKYNESLIFAAGEIFNSATLLDRLKCKILFFCLLQHRRSPHLLFDT